MHCRVLTESFRNEGFSWVHQMMTVSFFAAVNLICCNYLNSIHKVDEESFLKMDNVWRCFMSASDAILQKQWETKIVWDGLQSLCV